MILLSLLTRSGCVLAQPERRWDGCAVGCWGAGGDMAHRSLCGAGTWGQAQQSFLFFGMASAVPASCEPPPSHSVCHAESRDIFSYGSSSCWVWTPNAMQWKQDFPTFYRLWTGMPCRSGLHSHTADTKSMDFCHVYMELHPFANAIID